MAQGQGDVLTGFGQAIRTTVTGTVDYINQAHGWARVRYLAGDGSVQHECFSIGEINTRF